MSGNGWVNFIAAFAVFFASHMILIRPPIRPVLVRLLGTRGFSAAYSALSVLILWWLIEAAKTAPYVEVWMWAPWQNWVPILTMFPVCLILAFGVAVPNPFSFGGIHNDRFDPKSPGLIRWMRHPILGALFLWSAAHLVPNGDLAHVILFGTFALFSFLGMKIIDKRRRRELGSDWTRLLEETNQANTTVSSPGMSTLIRFAIAVIVYVALAHSHVLFAGVDPFA
ncbi:MAG: NnrU family protein [Roseibium sp.]|uniref:NnrU family protein n=1 Tax=Roseibium sp. TaxID=1936156 RepID=UPI0026218A67|nr:NnrU family protein [Roseibium sp.]MCV0429214.1 NnrU family protein [Roseibium sp.]